MELRNYGLGLRLCSSLDWHHLPSILCVTVTSLVPQLWKQAGVCQLCATPSRHMHNEPVVGLDSHAAFI